MIRYALRCEAEHAFEGWFRSSDDFDSQASRGLVACPECGSTHVERALMAPAVATGRAKDARAAAVQTAVAAMAAAGAGGAAGGPGSGPGAADGGHAGGPAGAGASGGSTAEGGGEPAGGSPPLSMTRPDPRALMMMEMLRHLKRHVEATAENVGERFPEEARKIHYGESDERGIYGQASRDEVEALLEEGIEVHALPLLPEERN